MRLIVLLGVIPITLAAQAGGAGAPPPAPPASTAPQAPETRPEDLCSIEGQIFNSVSGEPLRKAEIILNRTDVTPDQAGLSSSFGASSDAGGKFSMKGIEPGKYRMRVTRNGFVDTQYGAHGASRAGGILSLDKGQKMTNVVFRMIPQAVITGRIVDQDGDPMPNVQIQLGRFGYAQGKRQLQYVNGEMTNDLGEYRLHGIAPGKYLLTATYRAFVMPFTVDASAKPAAEEDYIPTYYPGTADPAAAAMLDVGPGASIESINLRLSKAHTVHVRGHVTQTVATGRPPIVLTMVPRGSNTMQPFMGMNRARPDAKGNFDMRGVAPGAYWLRANINQNGQSAGARVAVDVGAENVDNVNVVIGPGISFPGRVRVDGDTTQDLSNLRVRLTPRENGQIMAGPQPNVKPADDRSFRIENVSPDAYNVLLAPLPDGFYVKSIRAGDVDVLASGLDLSGGPPQLLDILISPNAGQVAGTVQDANTQQGAP